MIRKFNVEVTRIDEYVIEIDDSIVTKEWMENFQRVFWDLDNGIEDLASYLATYQARNGSGDGFIEGFGNVTRGGELPFSGADFDEKGNWLPESERRKPTPGYNIEIRSEDDNCDTEVTEILPPTY